MKKALLSAIILVVFTLTACNSEKANMNKITTADLTDEEKAFISSSTTKSLVYDFQVDEAYKNFSFCVEKYVNGVKSDDVITSIETEISGKNILFFFTNDDPKSPPNTKSTLNLTLITDKGHIKVATEEIIYSETSSGDVISAWSPTVSYFDSKPKTAIQEDMVIGYIVYDKGNALRTGLTDEFISDPKSHLNEISGYDITYLLRCKFTA